MAENRIIETDVAVRDASLHLRSVHGDPDRPPILIAHGWPESSAAWVPVLERAAADGATVHAVDLPGVGGSTRGSTTGSKRELAQLLGELAETSRWRHPRLVGHDAGGMIAYAALRAAPVFERVVIANTVVPGVAPWDDVYGNPNVFHFRLHAIPGFPEDLAEGRQRTYFDFFLDLLADDPSRIDEPMREAFAAAYGTREALTAGFDWYRAFREDAEQNIAQQSASDASPAETPVLYLRGDAERVDLDAYLAGFRAAGLRHVDGVVVPHAGHSASIESPDATWAAIRDFCA